MLGGAGGCCCPKTTATQSDAEIQWPIASFDTRPVKAGNEFRINLYRLQGPHPPPPARRELRGMAANRRIPSPPAVEDRAAEAHRKAVGQSCRLKR
jgi:hypothetical protein